MKRKTPKTISIEEMLQEWLDKAYYYEVPRDQLIKMIETKWSEEEEGFRKKTEVYLVKNQSGIESYEPYIYDYRDGGNMYSKFKNEFDSIQRYNLYLEVICTMHKLFKNKNLEIDLDDLHSLLIDNLPDLDISQYEEVFRVIYEMFEDEVCLRIDDVEFQNFKDQYWVVNNCQLTVLGMVYLVEKENS